MSRLNTQIKQAIDSFDISHARNLLRDAINEANAETYYLASLVALDDDQKHEFLEKAISLDPFHEKARVALKGNNLAASQNMVEAKPSQESTGDSSAQLNAANMVVATVREGAGEVAIRHIPVDTGMVVTILRQKMQLFLISRDDHAVWFQVLYQSPVGIKYGWLRADQIEGISLRNSAINILDLPITNFELNTRDDVKQLIKEMKKQPSLPPTPEAKKALYIFVALSLLSFVSLFATIGTGHGPLGLGIFFLAMLIGGFVVSRGRKLNAPALEEMSLRKKRIERYNQIQSNMRSDYEVMRDDQRRDTAIGFATTLAANLLNTAASRYIPDRQKVMIEQQTKQTKRR